MAIRKSDIIAQSQRLKAELIKVDEGALSLLEKSYVRALDNLQNKLDAVTEKIAEAQKNGELVGISHPSWLPEQERYKELMAHIDDELGRFGGHAASVVEAQQKTAADMGLKHSSALMEASLGPVPEAVTQAGLSVNFNKINVGAIEKMAGFLADGSPLDYKFAQMADGLKGIVKETMISDLIQGVGPRQMARNVNRAAMGQMSNVLTTCRTETMRAYRSASDENYKANEDILDGWIWSSAHQSRTCAACWGMDGTVHKNDEPLIDHASGRCCVPGTLITGPLATAFSSRHYNGEVITIRTAGGKELTVTPNHPILTRRGWVAAGLLNERDDVVCDGRNQRTSAGVSPYEYDVPTPIEDIASSLRMDRLASVPVSAEDFHGDGRGSNVCVIWANSLLWDKLNTAFIQPSGQKGFCWRRIRLILLPCLGNLASMFMRVFNANTKLLSNSNASKMLFLRRLLSKKSIRFGLASSINSRITKPSFYQLATNAKRVGQFVNRCAAHILVNKTIRNGISLASCRRDSIGGNLVTSGLTPEQSKAFEMLAETGLASAELLGGNLTAFASNISFDGIVEIKISAFDGHVYNLQTPVSWFIANSIITHNCTKLPQTKTWAQLFPNLDLSQVKETRVEGWDSEAHFSKLSEADQRKVLGNAKHEAWKAGNLNLRDIPGVRQSSVWGDSIRVKTVDELGLIRNPLPNYGRAVIPEEKFTKYALDITSDEGKHKAFVFESVLGYNQTNANELIGTLRSNLGRYPAFSKGETEHGRKYEILMQITGPSKRSATVVTGWIIRNGDTHPTLTTAYVKSKGAK